MSQTAGYPEVADILTFLADRNVEEITENNPSFLTESRQHLWRLLNLFDWASVLNVHAPTPTTINVLGGSYIMGGVQKTYTPGSDINPTDNDTTYVWMNTNNAVGYGVDGNGWPSTEHIKLAEVDVDSGGNITAIRDKRSGFFMNYTEVLDEDDMQSNSATKPASQQSVREYVGSRIMTYENEVLCYEGDVLTY